MFPFIEIPFLRGPQLFNWLQHSGSKLFTEFESGAQALHFLRAEGAHIATQTFYAIRRDVLGRVALDEERIAAFNALEGDELIPLGMTNLETGWNFSSNFHYRTKVTGFDPATGESTEKFFSVSSGRQLTKNQVFDTILGMIVGDEDFYQIMPNTIELDSAYGRGDVLL